ncbi:MAG TPA: adenine deaminase [Anaerolineales bacterium]|nr:adenine deaminase [Anaerolineales bacterium]HMZ44587.1 adenine deaminase [Anaerolineales bacterium]HNA54473.1 adenine deaminase [Anaerolineales bacterium]HNC87583.1 adenine deaminase [Anaerolineales bacterium]HNE68408.1 adenine deaminase [Anaerolineales bacterium]
MTPSTKLTRSLVDVAMGRTPADLVIRGGKWVSVQSGEIIPHTDIAIVNGHVAFVGHDASHAIGKKTKVIEANGRYLVPGLLDGHMHVESGMVTVTEFVRTVAVRGTTGMFIDPHEIANVFGLKGVKLMVDEAQKQPIHVWVQMPSCVPSAPGLETPGSSIGPKEVAEAMKWKGIIGLGEMMNFPGVFMGDKKMLDEMSATHAAGKTIGGHYASPDLGLPFHGYVAGGAEDDHEGTRLEDAIARVRQGMKAMLRYGSAWHDVANQVKAITEKKMDSRRFILCTDDSHAETLTVEGHMDRVLRHAIAEGLNPMAAIQMMTINTAEHFGLTKEMGMIAPGRWADVLLVEDLMNFKADVVIAKGQVIAEKGELLVKLPAVKYPRWATRSVHLKRPLKAEDFVLRTRAAHGSDVDAHVIGVIENQAPTRHLRMKVKAENGEVKADMKRDLAKIAVVERHRATGKVMVGLISGLGFTRPCAIASTVAHDSHHMIVVGTDDGNMAIAANELAQCGGGQVVVMNGEVIGRVELQIAGLMSSERADVVAKKAGTVLDGFKTCGSELNNPNMQLSLSALVVIPELRISDKGLVDVTNFEFISVLDE